MNYKKNLIPFLLLVVFTLLLNPFQALSEVAPDYSNDPGYKAFTEAAKTEKYLMINLYSGTADKALTDACTTARDALSEKVGIVSIDTKNAGTGFLMTKYRLNYAPVPIVIVIAPNGVITGSFRDAFTPEQVKAGFKTPKTLQCLRAFQDRKLVFISAQGKETKENSEAVDGITKFISENPLYATEMIIVDPKDKTEAALLKQLNVRPDIDTAQTFMLAPPGRIMGRWAGATDSANFVNRLKMLAKSCSSPSCADPNCK